MLIFRVTREELRRKGACESGLALFDTIKTMQDDERAKRGRKPRRAFQTKLTLLHQLWLAATYPQFLAWLIDMRLMPCVNGRLANLEGANLEGANLIRANLYGANLQNANLRGADLDGANLQNANLRGANLYGANLRDANLYGANLQNANLRGANLDGANLRGANLQNANRLKDDSIPNGWQFAACGCCLEPAKQEQSK